MSTTPDLFRAFADPTRLRLLNLLLERELCVCDLWQLLGEIQPKVSRHLAFLRRAGLVSVRRDRKWKHYSVIKRPSGLHRTLLNCVKNCLRETEVLRDDLARLRAMPPGGYCDQTGMPFAAPATKETLDET